MAPKLKKTQKSYRRGGKKHYAALALKSVDSRIKRHIEVAILRNKAKITAIPCRKRDSDAGYDIATPDPLIIPALAFVSVHTGLQINCPVGYFCEIRGRSSLNGKLEIIDGIIDATYTGEIIIKLRNLTCEIHSFAAGTRIAQLIFLPQIHVQFREVDSFEVVEGDRGAAGFGSTGL